MERPPPSWPVARNTFGKPGTGPITGFPSGTAQWIEYISFSMPYDSCNVAWNLLYGRRPTLTFFPLFNSSRSITLRVGKKSPARSQICLIIISSSFVLNPENWRLLPVDLKLLLKMQAIYGHKKKLYILRLQYRLEKLES